MKRPTLSSAEWAGLMERFHELLELAPEAQAEALARVAATDAAGAELLGSLLAAHERPGPLPTLELPAAALPTGGRIGSYRLLDALGTGGMGVVYLAEREGADYTQRVALKLIRAGFADPRLEERLRRERRLLARLEHPGIARFIDGGTTDTGQSWFAMEYVEGTSLLDYCEDRALGLPQRLALFLEVCEAVRHAHQQRVVHGDLKPANILVAADGRARLLDFGIAELLEADPATRDPTRTTPWLTPAYAAPEQFLGERLTPATDIYALGVVLFELLTGQRPFPSRGGSPAELARVAAAHAPPRPSGVVQDRRLARQLHGDLDTITLKALAAEPERRYASAEELAADLRRHLAGEPVTARPDTAGYRIGKFVRRHRAAVTAAGVALLALVGGLASTAWQARVARRERDAARAAQAEVESVSGFLIALFESSDPLRTGADTGVIRGMLLQGQAQVEALGPQPALQARMLEALGRVHTSLGRHQEALALQERALAVRRAYFGEVHPEVAASLSAVAAALRRRERIREADSLLELALAMARETLGDRHPQVARTLLTAAGVTVAAARLDVAERQAREAVAIASGSLPPGDPTAAEALRVLASVLRRRGRPLESEQYYRAYIEYQRRHLGPAAAATGAAMIHLADLYQGELDRPAVAESLAREGLAIEERVLGIEHPMLLHARGSLATSLTARGAYAEAESLLRRNLVTAARLAGQTSGHVAGSLAALSSLARVRGRLPEAVMLAESALAMHRAEVTPGSAGIAGSLLTLAAVRLDQGLGAEALQLEEEALALRRRSFGDHHPLVANSLEGLAEVHRRLGHRAVAESLLVQSLAILDRLVEPAHYDRRRMQAALDAVRREGRLTGGASPPPGRDSSP